jgi:hypothetical protein
MVDMWQIAATMIVIAIFNRRWRAFFSNAAGYLEN